MKRHKSVSNNKETWFVCDFETVTADTDYYKKNKHSRVILWGAQQYNKHKLLEAQNGIYKNQNIEWGLDIESFFDFIMSHNKSVTCLFHNLSFDGDFILKGWKRIFGDKFKFAITEEELEQIPRGIYVNASKSNIYNFKVKNTISYKTEQGKRVFKVLHYFFTCTQKKINPSVDMLGKSFKLAKHNTELKKGFYDREPWETKEAVDKEFLEYMFRDIIIVNAACQALDSLVNEKFINSKKKWNTSINIMDCWSTSQLAMKIYRQVFEPKAVYEFIKDNEGLECTKDFLDSNGKINRNKFTKMNSIEGNKIARESYKGGYTFGNFSDIWSEAFKIDINSAYPYAMTKPLPFGTPLIGKPLTGTYLTLYRLIFKSAKKKPQYEKNRFSILRKPVNKDLFNDIVDWARTEEYLSTLNVVKDAFYEYTIWKEEWELWNKMYDFNNVKIVETYYYRSHAYFKRYINTVYEMKRKYKGQAFEPMVKLMLNGCYGKMGQKEFTEGTVYSDNTFIKGDMLESTDKKDVFVNREFKGLNSDSYSVYVTDIVKEMVKSNSNVAAASYITMSARVQLQTLILDNVDLWIYSDTDSIIFSKPIDNFFGSKIEDRDKLGAFKVEDLDCKFLNFGNKRYVIINKEGRVSIKWAGATVRNVEVKYDLVENLIKANKGDKINLEEVLAKLEVEINKFNDKPINIKNLLGDKDFNSREKQNDISNGVETMEGNIISLDNGTVKKVYDSWGITLQMTKKNFTFKKECLETKIILKENKKWKKNTFTMLKD